MHFTTILKVAPLLLLLGFAEWSSADSNEGALTISKLKFKTHHGNLTHLKMRVTDRSTDSNATAKCRMRWSDEGKAYDDSSPACSQIWTMDLDGGLEDIKIANVNPGDARSLTTFQRNSSTVGMTFCRPTTSTNESTKGTANTCARFEVALDGSTNGTVCHVHDDEKVKCKLHGEHEAAYIGLKYH